LAGAVASIQYYGQELIATGGHGASFQYALHSSYPSRGLPSSECDNPTEAGSKSDDAGAKGDPKLSPWLSSSSSGIMGFSTNSPTQIATRVNMAYYVPENDTSDFSGNCAPYWQTGKGFVDGGISWFILNKWITLGVNVGGTFYPNILAFDARFEIPRDVENMDVTLVAYLSRRLQQEIFYDPRSGAETIKPRGAAKTPGFTNVSQAPVTRIFTDSAWGTAVGVITPPSTDPHETQAPWLYTTTNDDIVAPPNYTFVYRNVASQHIFADLHAGDVVDTHTYFIIGSVKNIEATTLALCHVWGTCGKN